jgi:hypothetical protein
MMSVTAAQYQIVFLCSSGMLLFDFSEFIGMPTQGCAPSALGYRSRLMRFTAFSTYYGPHQEHHSQLTLHDEEVVLQLVGLLREIETPQALHA